MIRTASRRRGGSGLQLLIGIGLAVFAVISYLASTEFNPITGENQHLSLSPEQEISLGQQAAPQMAQEFGGLYQDSSIQADIDAIGFRLVNESVAANTPWVFDFHVLDDPQTVNAFALPGGQIFITSGLLSRMESEAMVAGVLAHEIVHVLARHSAQHIAQSELTNGLVGAVAVASGDANATQLAAMVGQFINMRYGREDELQSDALGVCLMIDAGYDPQALIQVMQVLAEASGGTRVPEFASTHPDPGNRVAAIQEAIQTSATRCAALGAPTPAR